MKNQYVGDINDYLKYGLLRDLARGELGLGVVWMLTPSDSRNDGRRLSYLSQRSKYRPIDPALFDSLGQIVYSDSRTVHAVEGAGLLPASAYVSGELHDDLTRRYGYFTGVWTVTQGSKLVFFDPDNGLAVASVRKGSRASSKYLYWDELETAYSQEASVVVYQHFPRRTRALFLKELASRCRDVVGAGHVSALVTSHVAFVVLSQPRHEIELDARLRAFARRAAPFATAITLAT